MISDIPGMAGWIGICGGQRLEPSLTYVHGGSDEPTCADPIIRRAFP